MSKDEQRINESNTGQFIQDATETDLRGLLAYCFSLTGLNTLEIPKEAANAVLIDFIKSDYGTFRISEVREAFKMNAAGRFGDVIEHFQNFSPVYFGKVMQAFRKRSQELKAYQESARSWNQPVQPLRKENEIPDEEMVRLSYANYMKVGNWQLIYPGCYDTLARYGHGLDFDEGAKQRGIFTQLKDAMRVKDMFPETTERRFKQWLSAVIFKKLIAEGKKEIRL